MKSHLINATPVDVSYVDGSTETLPIARLSIRQLYTFAHHLANERVPELISMCTGKSIEWIDTLADESYAVLVNKVIELNFTRASVIAKTDPTLAALLIPFAQKVQTLVILGASLGLTLSEPLPAPASSGSPGVTGTESSSLPQADSSSSSQSTAA